MLFGINGPFEGSMVLQGKSYTSMTPHIAKKNGLCYMTGINTEEGLLSNSQLAKILL